MGKQKYLMGLDLGTNSVGWAVLDENSHLVKKGGKTLWVSRLFEEAEDASSRRMARSSRRRTQRRAERIDLLQMLFMEEMQKQDPAFFLRLNQSMYHEEDRDERVKGANCILFADPHYTYKDFYREYPTI